MEMIINILVYLGVLVTNVYYPQSHVDHQIQVHKPEIEAVQSNPEQMNQVKMYTIRYDRPGYVVVVDPDNHEDASMD